MGGPETSHTIGIDLAAQPKRTAVCRVEWSLPVPFVDVPPGAPWTDAALLELISGGAKVGIDCPLGWPQAFGRLLASHATHEPWPRDIPLDDRTELTLRLTDRVVRGRPNGRAPLSVSTDRIGVVALRCAAILSQLAEPVDRAGGAVVAEVYPAAALREWSLESQGSYKHGGEPLSVLLDRLLARLPLAFAAGIEDACRTKHDMFDALVSAIVAREVERDRTLTPEDEVQSAAARLEGWIHLPTHALGS